MVNTSGIISTIAGNGISGFSGDGGQATNAKLNGPQVVVFDALGNLYFGDGGNFRVRMINTTGIITTIAGNGVQSFSGDGGAATLAELNYPYCVALDAFNNLYIVDSNNERIRKVSNLQTTGISKITESQSQIYVYPNPASTQASLSGNIENSTLVITDMLSNITHLQIITSSNFQIGVTDLKEGIYNLSISGKEGTVNKRLVIIR